MTLRGPHGPSQGVWRGGPMRSLGSGHVTCGEDLSNHWKERSSSQGTDTQTDIATLWLNRPSGPIQSKSWILIIKHWSLGSKHWALISEHQSVNTQHWVFSTKYRVVYIQGGFFLTWTPQNCLSTRSHVNWPRISLSVRGYKGILYLEK